MNIHAYEDCMAELDYRSEEWLANINLLNSWLSKLYRTGFADTTSQQRSAAQLHQFLKFMTMTRKIGVQK